MKKVCSMILSLAIIFAVTVLPFGASACTPANLYTVSSDTPTCEEAIKACGGDLSDTQKTCFQLPAEDLDHIGELVSEKTPGNAEGTSC